MARTKGAHGMAKLAWLHNAIQHDGSINLKYVVTAQQSSNSFAKGFPNFETWRAPLSTIALYDMNHQKITTQSFETSAVAQSERDGRIALELQHTADEEPDVYLQNAQCHNVRLFAPCMSRARRHHEEHELPFVFPGEVCSGAQCDRPPRGAFWGCSGDERHDRTRARRSLFQVREAYVASDSTLKLKSQKTKVGYRGPELATMDKLKAAGGRCRQGLMACRGGCRKPPPHPRSHRLYTGGARTPTGHGRLELRARRLQRDERSRSRAAIRFEEQIIDNAAMITCWSGSRNTRAELKGCARFAHSEPPPLASLQAHRPREGGVLGLEPSLRRDCREVYGLPRRQISAWSESSEGGFDARRAWPQALRQLRRQGRSDVTDDP